ncbi:MAG: TIGR02757 family protein [Sandaracinaceae bacterium]
MTGASLAHVRRRLDALLAEADLGAHRAADPVSFVHRYPDPADREVAGLVAALLAFGQVAAVRASVDRALAALGPRPARTVDTALPARLDAALRGFVHRVYRGPHLSGLLARAGAVRRAEGSLGAALAGEVAGAGGDLREGLARLSDRLRGDGAPRGLKHLVPDPRAGSACKRTLLYLRWMVRPADGVDLGLWPLSPAILLIPVDTHVLRISRNLRLTDRTDASWRTAVEITEALRRFDPEDPVKYDFALCHLGVSRACPSRRDPDKCERCVLRSACRHWRSARAGHRRGRSRRAGAVGSAGVRDSR